jgi:hypothetical protein
VIAHRAGPADRDAHDDDTSDHGDQIARADEKEQPVA